MKVLVDVAWRNNHTKSEACCKSFNRSFNFNACFKDAVFDFIAADYNEVQFILVVDIFLCVMEPVSRGLESIVVPTRS